MTGLFKKFNFNAFKVSAKYLQKTPPYTMKLKFCKYINILARIKKKGRRETRVHLTKLTERI